jgi:F0F1-type ATP synthase assembly protein I
MPETRKPDRNAQSAPSLWRLATMGVDLAAAVGGFTLVGWLADRYWQVFPRYTIAGAVLGLVGGMYNLVRQALAASRPSAGRRSRHADAKRDRGRDE